MDESQEAFKNLNSKYSALLAAVEVGPNGMEKCKIKNDILVKLLGVANDIGIGLSGNPKKNDIKL